MPSRLSLLALASVAALAACGTADPAAPAADGAPLPKKDAAGNGGHPARYVLPGAAVFPEGIAFDARTGTIYVTSTTDGTILCGDVKDDTLAPCLPGGAGGRTTAVGIDVGSQGQLFVAGGQTGKVFVVGASGAPLATLTGTTGASFVNDVVVVRGDTAYATDSQNPVIYRVAPSGGTYVLEPWLPLAGTAIEYQAGFNLNGIAASPDGRTLYVVQSNTGYLFRIDVATRTATRITVDGGTTFVNGDGLEVRGNTLYVMQNARATLSEIRLRGDGTTGTLVSETTDPSFRFPTTFVEARGRFLVVNSQFDQRGPGLAPELPFTVSVIGKP